MKENKILNKKLKVLCVCTRGMNRSKYLAKYLEGRGYSNRAGGSQPFKDSNKPQNPIFQEDIVWADAIIVMREWIFQLIKNGCNLSSSDR